MSKSKHCLICNKQFVPNKTNQRYCSDDCRNEAYRNTKNVCMNCGREFAARKGSMFCSPECRKIGAYTRGRKGRKTKAGLSEKLIEQKAQGITYAEAQKADTIARYAKVEV